MRREGPGFSVSSGAKQWRRDGSVSGPRGVLRIGSGERDARMASARPWQRRGAFAWQDMDSVQGGGEQEARLVRAWAIRQCWAQGVCGPRETRQGSLAQTQPSWGGSRVLI